MLPDAELVVSAYLRSRDDVAAVVDRVGTRTPPSTDEPWVRISLLGDQPDPISGRALHLAAAFMQLDCYAGDTGGQAEASLIARTVREALHAMPDAAHDGAVVTGVTASMIRLPDTEFSPARERYSVSATVYLHP